MVIENILYRYKNSNILADNDTKIVSFNGKNCCNEKIKGATFVLLLFMLKTFFRCDHRFYKNSNASHLGRFGFKPY